MPVQYPVISNQNATPVNPNPPPRTFNLVNPTPVWRPFNSFSNNSQRFAHNRSNHFRQHRAEPMDTSSGNTRRSVRPQNQAQNPNKPKFISEELFQQEVDNNLDHAPNPGCFCEQNYYFDEPSEYLTQETGEYMPFTIKTTHQTSYHKYVARIPLPKILKRMNILISKYLSLIRNMTD
ncbi:hypothetical protein HHI36_008375 [Cryptolaemus montrouzieri]|uniref:Uncharacterized protein n=1 Tax=Cryptolaemus montrouzieri TaxID=559131 RepID=A0ABD2MSU3_9CUCU